MNWTVLELFPAVEALECDIQLLGEGFVDGKKLGTLRLDDVRDLVGVLSKSNSYITTIGKVHQRIEK
eukprot:CAMPEP_0206473018 /NCGR_PEP_ID=MMETSP0324_2-20121206/32587_1 /ASSEMBLY_ACC=CAM_ASM_000836 /TAXON_ID=2866 /ORGANISM="Crypthecodinium cohnii, Strain Seligo" /LENGTH=66 /DNA_ID=CAMNT_0053947811 /DNA_START=357 /DNA_END=557 /DNA_ORIENTATION=-